MDQDRQNTEQPQAAPQQPTIPPTPATPGLSADQQIHENTPGMEDNSGSMPKKRALALLAVIALVGLAYLLTRVLK